MSKVGKLPVAVSNKALMVAGVLALVSFLQSRSAA